MRAGLGYVGLAIEEIVDACVVTWADLLWRRRDVGANRVQRYRITERRCDWALTRDWLMS